MVNQSKGIELCRILYDELGPRGVFPALTGGLLYKDGERKDIDIVLYRHRQNMVDFEVGDIQYHLACCGVEVVKLCGFVTKAKWKGLDVDIFNPETNTELNNPYGEGE